jgi:general nucleoside transport system permease protein
MTTVIVLGVIAGALASGVSVYYAALGEVVGQRAGIVNLGIEGVMLVGAATSFAVTAITGSAVLGLFAGAAAGIAFNLILGLLVVTRRTNQLASGLALWFLGTGASTLIGLSYTGTHIDGLGEVRLPGSDLLPAAWARVIDQDILVYLGLPAALAVTWLLWRTRWGLHLRAVGEDRMAAFAAGLNPAKLQYQALALAGALYGLGGAQLALAYTKTWQEGMTAGRGFVAVVIVIFALWRPLRAIAGALLFGGAVALGLQLQVRGVPVSPFLLDMLPYVLTLLVVLVFGRPKAFAVPMGLREVFGGTAK